MKSLRSLRALGALAGLVTIGANWSHALTAGDIAFTMFNTGPNPTVNGQPATSATSPQHQFSFVTLADLANGQTIFFTDVGVTSSNTFYTGGTSRDSVIQYTNNTGSTITAGAQITIGDTYLSGLLTGVSVINGLGTASVVTGSPFGATNAYLLLSESGDSLIAYTATTATSTPTFLTGFNETSGGGWQTDATGANDSALPSTLSNGTSAISFTAAGSFYAQFNFSLIGSSIANGQTASQWGAIFNNSSNWNTSTSTPQTYNTSTIIVSAIPEPLTSAAFAGVASLGIVLFCKRTRNARAIRNA